MLFHLASEVESREEGLVAREIRKAVAVSVPSSCHIIFQCQYQIVYINSPHATECISVDARPILSVSDIASPAMDYDTDHRPKVW